MKKIFAFLIVLMVLFLCVSVDAWNTENCESHSVSENVFDLIGCESKIQESSSIEHENIKVYNHIKIDKMYCLSLHEYKRDTLFNLNNGPEIMAVSTKKYIPPKIINLAYKDLKFSSGLFSTGGI